MTRRTEYPEGFFTDLMREHDFPPGFVSRMPPSTARVDEAIRDAAIRSRQAQLAIGNTGSIRPQSAQAAAALIAQARMKSKRA